jgi:peptidyl-dipeptidase A
MKHLTSAIALAAMLLATGAAPAPTAADADAFVAKAEKDLEELGIFAARAAWVNATYITDDTDILAARTGATFTEAGVRYASEAAKYAALPGLSYDTKRKLDMLRQGLVAPAPNTPGAADTLSTLLTGLQSAYGKGKGTYKGEVKSGNDLEELMGTERDPELLKEMWVSWHKIGVPMRNDYTQFVSISNAGSKELGYADTGAQWRAGYDMDPDAFAKLTDDTWNQVKPRARSSMRNTAMPYSRKPARSAPTFSATCGHRSGGISTMSSHRKARATSATISPSYSFRKNIRPRRS